MLTLYILDETVTGPSEDGIPLSACPIFFEDKDEIVGLYEFEAKDVGDVFLVSIKNETYYPLATPQNVRDAIVYFLAAKHGKQDINFMCFDFAFRAAFGDTLEKEGSLDKYWKFKPFSQERLEPGSYVMLAGERVDGIAPFSHAAIYLGKGLFVSVYGGGGDLQVSTLKHLQASFASAVTVIATPRT